MFNNNPNVSRMSLPQLPESVSNTLNDAAVKFRIRGAQEEFAVARSGLSIPDASRRNFQQVRADLRRGLVQPQGNSPADVRPLPPRPMEAAAGDTLLTHKEAQLFAFISNT
jgi:hypothetical protein